MRQLEHSTGKGVLWRLAELAEEFDAEEVARTARAVSERVSEGRFYVACVGQFKRGKSTLLNALIGDAILPTGVIPVTSVPCIIRYGQNPAARVRLQETAWQDIAPNEIAEYVSEEKNPENAKGVTGLEIFVPHRLLEDGMCLVDTPGLGSIFAGNTAATQAFLPHIDAAIIVIGADPPLSGDELQLAERVAGQVHDLLFVLNKADRTSDGERVAASEFARNALKERLKREVEKIFEVSALEQLEGGSANQDWGELVGALEQLVQKSGRALVLEASERTIQRTGQQLLAILQEERGALQRPLEQSEQRIETLRKTLENAEGTVWELGVLLTAEQQRLSATFAERRDAFLKRNEKQARKSFQERIGALARRRNGPAYRRELNHTAQEIARGQLLPWLEEEAKFAGDAFRKAAGHFVELGNQFLRRLRDTEVSGLEDLPELDQEEALCGRSRFHFHLIERVAAPASPLLFLWDLALGGIGVRGGMIRDGEEFLGQLLEVNSSRVQSDVDERVRESRRQLDAKIKEALRESLQVANRALSRARAAQRAGGSEVAAALAKIDMAEREIRQLGSFRTVGREA